MTPSEPGEAASAGLFSSLRRALAGMVELLHVRLELIGVDLETALGHWLGLLLWLLLAIFTGALAILMLVLTVLIAFWDTHRLLAAGLITLLLAGTTLAALLAARRRVRNRPALLASTIAELRRDAAALDGKER